MLARERESILNAVAARYQELHSEELKEVETRREAVRDVYRADTRVLDLAKALTNAGITSPSDLAFRLAAGAVGGITGYGPGSVRDGLQKDLGALTSTTKSWGGSTAYHELSIALTSSAAKWPVLQPHVYLLISELGAAKEIEDINKAVRTFTAGIA